MEPSGICARRGCEVGLEPLAAPPSHQLSRLQENYMPFHAAKYGNDSGDKRADSLPSHSNISPMPKYSLKPSNSNDSNSNPEGTTSILLVQQPYRTPTAPLPITRTELLRRTHSAHSAPTSVTETSISNKSRVSSLLARFELTAKEILEQDGHATVPTTIDVHHLSEPNVLLSRSKNHEQIQQKIVLYNNHKPLEAIQDANDSNNTMSIKESMIRSLLLCGAVPLPHLRGGDREMESDKDKVEPTMTIEKPVDETTLVQTTSRSIMEFSLCGGGIDDTIEPKEAINVIQKEDESPIQSITKISSTPVELVRMNPVVSGQPGWQCTPTIAGHLKSPQDMTICTSTMMNQDVTSPMSDETQRRRDGARNLTPKLSQKYISTTTSATADDSFLSESYVEDDDCHSGSSCSNTSAAATGGTSKRRKLILSSKSRDDDDDDDDNVAAIVTKSVSFSPTVDSMGREYVGFADPSADLANDDDDDDSRDDEPEETGATKRRSRAEKVDIVAPDRYASPGDRTFLEMEDNDRNCGQEVLFVGTEHQLPLENPDVWASPSNPTRVAYRREPGHSPTTTVLTTAVLPLDELLSDNMDSDWDAPKHKTRGDAQTNVLAQNSGTAEHELRSIGSNPPSAKRELSDASISYEQAEIGMSQTFPPFAKNPNFKSSRDMRPISPESNHRRSTRPLQKSVDKGVASIQEADHDLVEDELANVATSNNSTRRSPLKKKESSAHPSKEGTKVATSKKSKSRSPKKKRESTTLETLEDATKISSRESKSRSPHKKRVSKTSQCAADVTTVHDAPGERSHGASSTTNDKPTSSRCETLAPATLSEERTEDGLDVLVPVKSSCKVLKFQLRKDVALRPQLQSVLDEIQRRRAERQSASIHNGDEEQGTKQDHAEVLTAVDEFISPEAISEQKQFPPDLRDSGPIITEPNRAGDPKKSKVFKSAFDEYDCLLDQLLRQNKSLKEGESASQTSLGDDSGILRDRIAWIRRERDQAIDLYDFSLDDALKTMKEDNKGNQSCPLIASNIEYDTPKSPVQSEYDLPKSPEQRGTASSAHGKDAASLVLAANHRSKSCPPTHAASLAEQTGNRAESLSPTKSRRNTVTSPSRGCGTPEMGQQTRQGSPPKTKMDTSEAFQPRFQTPAQSNSRIHDYLAAPSPTKTSPARLPFLAKLEEMLDRPPRVVSIEVREPRNGETTTIDCDEDTRQACSPQRRRHRRPATTTTAAAKSPMVPSPERKRRSGPTVAEASSIEHTRRLRRQLDLARLTNLAIRNSNQSLSLELEAFKQRLWQHRNCTRGERDILEACQLQLGSFQRHLEDKRKLPQSHFQHPLWSHNRSSTHFQESKSSSEESSWDEFSNIQGAMLANLELMRSARASMVGKVYSTRHGAVDEDTARLREVIAMMKRV